LCFVEIENLRAIRRTAIIPLLIHRGGIVYLEEEGQNIAVAGYLIIKPDFYGLGVITMIEVSGIW